MRVSRKCAGKLSRQKGGIGLSSQDHDQEKVSRDKSTWRWMMRVNSSRYSESTKVTLSAVRVFLVVAIAVLLTSGEALAAVQGSVVAWGLNEYGQSTVPMDGSGVATIAAGSGNSFADSP